MDMIKHAIKVRLINVRSAHTDIIRYSNEHAITCLLLCYYMFIIMLLHVCYSIHGEALVCIHGICIHGICLFVCMKDNTQKVLQEVPKDLAIVTYLE